MLKTVLTTLLILLLASCSGIEIPLVVTTPIVSPSPPPAIFSPTPLFIPSSTPEITIFAASLTPVPSLSITPAKTFTSIPVATRASGLELDILGCNTGLDIIHGMGEVTNAYPVIRNESEKDLTNVCATLLASDEARIHPDKTACIPSLPPKYQVTLKLTVDTSFRQDTSIQVDVTTAEGYSISLSHPSCRNLGIPGWVPAKAGIIEPIQ